MSAGEAPRAVEVSLDEDVRHVARLYDDYRSSYEPAPGVARVCAFLRERLATREAAIFLAVDSQNAALGFILLFATSHRMRRFWVLNDLYVRPESRRLGVARTLVRRAERYARETGSAGLTLATGIDNAAAIALYESEGYVRERNVAHYDRFF